MLIFTSFCLSPSLSVGFPLLPSTSLSLFSSITSSAMFSFNHPLKKHIHFRTTGLLLDHILCCYSCYNGQFLCSRGGQGLHVHNGPLQDKHTQMGAKVHFVGKATVHYMQARWQQLIAADIHLVALQC